MAFVTIVDVIGSVPQIPGAKMLVVDDGERHLTYGTVGGGKLEFKATSEAIECARSGKVMFFEKNLGKDLGMACGGFVKYVIEPVSQPEKLVICGGGHCGKAIHDVAVTLGFSVIVIDSMSEYANPQRFPLAQKIINSFEGDAIDSELQTDESTYIVIVSRDHPTDFKLCRYFTPKKWKYLGLIASKSKAAGLMSDMEKEGFDSEKLSKIASPIGLPIGGATPSEIAISVLAQIIQVRTGVNLKIEEIK